MSLLSFILFAISFFISYEGFLLMLGIKSDIEGGPIYIAFLFGLPLLILGLIFGIIDIIRGKKGIRNKYVDWSLSTRYLMTSLNAAGVTFWAIFVIINILKDT